MLGALDAASLNRVRRYELMPSDGEFMEPDGQAGKISEIFSGNTFTGWVQRAILISTPLQARPSQ